MNRFALIAALIMAASLHAAEIVVPDDYATVGGALLAASPGDIVTVGAGVYHESDLPVVDGLVLRGATGDAADVVLDGDGAARLIVDLDGVDDLTVEALTLRNGYGDAGGAVLLRSASRIQLLDCVFTDNHADGNGGAVSIESGEDPVTLRGCTFQGNTSGAEGGAVDHSGASLLVDDCAFDANASRLSGAGLRSVGGMATLRSSVFTGNLVDSGSGGGASVESGIVEACVFSGNSSGYHGGGLEAAPLLHMTDCEFVGNQANSVGGGALVDGGDIANCRFRDNGAGADGGGIQLIGPSWSLVNCSWTGNVALSRGGSVSSSTHGAAFAFVECTFSDSTAPDGAEGWFAADAAVTLKCCAANTSIWTSGSLIVDDQGCGVANESCSFGEMKAS